jgi:IS5 family transposase
MRTIQNQKKQYNFLYKDLIEQLNPDDSLLLLAERIPWESFERKFAELYSEKGRPAKPIRLMVGLLLLKQIHNLSDEQVVKIWTQNPYFQSFCGIEHFQWEIPCDPSDLVYFRKRIGEKGVEKIFQASVHLHGNKALEQDVVIDSTVQEKNITFPTDTKLRIKIIAKCLKIARKENIKLRRSFKRELRDKLRIIRFNKSTKDKQKVHAAIRRIKTIAGALLRDLSRKLSPEQQAAWADKIHLFNRVLSQQRKDKNKIYSLHEPDVLCIAKGKEHKKYEFGAKASVAMTKTDCIIVGVKSFSKNIYDGNTLTDTLSVVRASTGKLPERAYVDRGYKGRDRIMTTAIICPGPPFSGMTAYEKRKARKNFGRRSAVEPVIGHLKADFRLAKNYLKGVAGDVINLFLAAAAFNFRKWMRGIGVSPFFMLLVQALSALGSSRQLLAENEI